MGLRDRRNQRQRHARLLVAAERAISKQLTHGTGQDLRPAPATFIALAFGMFAIRLDNDEARDYLNAALAERGYPLLDEDEGGDR
ncbi:hypothetical protein [Streptomyces venezuelae]|uniref:hypothetical protein n=1 Tax=Streptomyces venezuelae TaxID=54571 RepID=UPI00365EF056